MKNFDINVRALNTLIRNKHSIITPLALCLFSANIAAEDFISIDKAHAKPTPYAVMPLYNLNQIGAEMPYIQPQAEPTQGAVDTVVNSMSRNVVIGSGYNSATGGLETFADAKLKTSKFYGRVIVVDESAGAYKGASGEEQRFGYERQAGQLVLGITPRSSTDVKFIYVRDIIKDNEMPLVQPSAYNNGSLVVASGFGMDPINTDREIVKLMWDEKFTQGPIKKMHLEAFSIQLNREADNYNLRTTPYANQMNVAVDRNMKGLKFDNDIAILDSMLNIGLSYTDISHDAQRNGGPTTSGEDVVSAYHYPGVEMDEWLLSATSEFNIAPSQQLTFGVNYKYVDADATKAEMNSNTPAAGNLSALELYQTYYGSDVEVAQSEGHLSGKLQWDYENSNDFNAYASVANYFRSPDTQERYFAATSFVPLSSSPMGPDARAVGNPELDWEEHRKIEMGLSKSSAKWIAYHQTRGNTFAWRVDANAYYDNINDFISRDRARGQTQTGVSDYARIWRNVDAVMSGIEIDAKANISSHVSSRLTLNVANGENKTDNRDLYGIAPFEGNLFVDYFDYLSTGGTWNVGTQLRYVAENNSVDADPTTGSGYDAGETDDFLVINLYASAQLSDRVGVKVGVNNIADKSYYDSAAKYPMEGNPYLVEAPERNFYIAVVANF